jgi:hypothetical protein
MISQESREVLSKINATIYGKALKEFLVDHQKTIGDIETCPTWEEALGRKFALKLIKDLFSFMEEPKPSSRNTNQWE